MHTFWTLVVLLTLWGISEWHQRGRQRSRERAFAQANHMRWYGNMWNEPLEHVIACTIYGFMAIKIRRHYGVEEFTDEQAV